MRGHVGPLGERLRLDMSAELRDFAVPRTNPYLVHHVAWEARDGWLSTTLRCRIDGEALDARTDIRLSRLQVARASVQDEGQARLGLPLGMIVSLMKDRWGDIGLSFPVGGRLNDPRFDFSEAIWSTIRHVAIKAITLPVSWIGRVRVGTDSRVERVEIDPIPFQRGLATLTPEGQEQVTRVVAFMEQLPEVRMAVTPVISPQDLAELKRQSLDAAIERIVRDGGLSSDAAAARLFQERFPHRPRPEAPDAVRAELLENAPPAQALATALALRRVETVRALMRKAGIDAARLSEAPPVEGPAGRDGEVKLDLAEPPQTPSPPGRKGPQAFRPPGPEKTLARN